MRNLISSLVVLVVLATGVRAQAQSLTPSPGHVNAAEELIAVMDMERTFNQSMGAMLRST